MIRFVLLLALVSMIGQAQPKKILYITHSAGFRHDCLPLSQQVLREIGARTGRLEVTATEDLSLLSNLAGYHAVVFFTSGELPLTVDQKQSLLNFVRAGGGFGGFHSATDTFYTWPEYGDLIGGRFDGHPWTQQVRIDVEDPSQPMTRHLAPSFAITDEIYQFREFSRANVRVLMTLDTTSVDTETTGVNRTDNDFALAWTRWYGNGRVFYTALGHFDDTWRDSRFQTMIEQSLLWLTGEIEGEAQPQPVVRPSIAMDGIGNAATLMPSMTISPGSFVSIFGANLTHGASMSADIRTATHRLAGTRVLMNGLTTPIVYASPNQVNFLVPLELRDGNAEITIEVPQSPAVTAQVSRANVTPGIFTTTVGNGFATLWATGMGIVRPSGALFETVATPSITVNGTPASVTFSGLAPGWPGLYQINITLPAGVTPPYTFSLQAQ